MEAASWLLGLGASECLRPAGEEEVAAAEKGGQLLAAD